MLLKLLLMRQTVTVVMNLVNDESEQLELIMIGNS